MVGSWEVYMEVYRQDQAELCRRGGIEKVWRSREGTLREGPQAWKLQMLGGEVFQD